MIEEKAIFNRAERLLGGEYIDSVKDKKVIVFGVGGVGSWCVEGLVRSGIRNITIVDSDVVCVTNVNRQLMATSENIGRSKVEELKSRLLSINNNAQVTAIKSVYNEQTAESFHLEKYDYIIDCIDSLKDKASLILNACKTRAVFFSSMGAALKIDPLRVRVAEFWKVQGCPLARALRKKFKSSGVYPKHKFMCVYSDELLTNKGEHVDCGTCRSKCAKAEAESESESTGFVKGQVNGSLVHITAIFGMQLAGLVVMDINKKIK